MLHLPQPHRDWLAADHRRNLQHYRPSPRPILHRGHLRTYDLLAGDRVHRGPIHTRQVGHPAQLHRDLLGLVYQRCLILPADKTSDVGEYVCCSSSPLILERLI